MPIPVAWIANGWIFSTTEAQSGRYWIDGPWIWGPAGSADTTPRYWIADGWIYGPVGAQDVETGFHLHGDWIWGPQARLPFVR